MPIASFTSETSADAYSSAIQAGVCAFAHDAGELHPVSSLWAAATARFSREQSLRNDIKNANDKLVERRIIERAKGALMQQRSCSESDAYRAMQKMAMDQNRKMVEIAEDVLAVLQIVQTD